MGGCLTKALTQTPEIIESQEVNIFDYVPIQGFMQAARAENESVYYFNEIDSMVRSILAKLDQDHKTSREKVQRPWW